MEQELLKMLAQFRILLKRAKGVQVDFEKIVADPAYARQVLGAAEDSDNEVLVTLALGIRDKLGFLAEPTAKPAAPAPAEPAPSAAAAKLGKKYFYGARG
jgi:hypothetical protein